VKRREITFLLLLTFAALLIHGYHPAAEDNEIYLPGITKILHPSSYPFGQNFFEAQDRLTLFPRLVVWSVWVTHLRLDWALFLWHLASIFLLLLACWRISSKCFSTPEGRWCSVALVAALLTLPVAGTALYILDQYANPRSISLFAVLFAVDAAIEKRYLRTALWLILTAAIHPLMVVFGLVFIALLIPARKAMSAATARWAALFFIGFPFRRPSAAYWECLQHRRNFFLLRWHWYEWLGILGPLALLWWFSRVAKRKRCPVFETLSRALFFLEVLCLAGGLLITIVPALRILAAYQPMRGLQLVYVFLMILGGGLLGESLLKNKPLRWLLLFVPMCAGMCFAQFQLFPGGQHVEWPGAPPKNPWVQAFAWIRANTPESAIFALDPNYMALPGEDHQGFRAIAERSRLADANKDWSVAVLYPWLPLADDCLAQTQAAKGWKSFGADDFSRLEKIYGVTWVVLQQPNPAVDNCPYRNSVVEVCRLN